MTEPSVNATDKEKQTSKPGADAAAETGSEPTGRTPAIYNSSEWDQPTKRAVIIILLVLMAVVLWVSRSVLPLVVVSAIIAYLVSPIVDLVERLRVPRAVITIILFVLLLVSIVLLPVFLVPIFIRQLSSLSFDVPSAVFGFINGLNETLYNLPENVELLGFVIPVSESVAQIQSNYSGLNFFPTVAEVLSYIQQLISTATVLVGTTAFIGFNVVGGLFQVAITFLIVFFLSLYMAKDAPQIRSYVASLFPASYQSEVVDVLRRMGTIWSAFFRGQIVLSLVVGLVTWGALSAMGMPGALLLGILAGLLEVIPNLGPTIAMIPAVIIALIQGSSVLGPLGISNGGFALITVAVYFIIQQLENNILVPRIIGSSVNLHPIVVILGVATGFQIFGILGALLAAPVIATLRVLGGYIHAKLLGYEPFLDQDKPKQRSDGFLYRRTLTAEELEAQAQAAAQDADKTADEPAEMEPAEMEPAEMEPAQDVTVQDKTAANTEDEAASTPVAVQPSEPQPASTNGNPEAQMPEEKLTSS